MHFSVSFIIFFWSPPQPEAHTYCIFLLWPKPDGTAQYFPPYKMYAKKTDIFLEVYDPLITIVVIIMNFPSVLRLMQASRRKPIFRNTTHLIFESPCDRHTTCNGGGQFKSRYANVHTVSLKAVKIPICKAKKWLWGWAISASSQRENVPRGNSAEIWCTTFIWKQIRNKSCCF